MLKSDLLIKELHRENLCTYFVLPLLKINKHKFITEDNFIDSYLVANCQSIIVQLKDVKSFEHRMRLLPYFDKILEDKNAFSYVKFIIPEEWHSDIHIFLQGRFSQLTPAAKDRIKKHSGLMYRVRVQGVITTDVRLLALEKRKNLRELWEEYLDCKIDEDQELLSIPNKKTFINERQLIDEEFNHVTNLPFEEEIEPYIIPTDCKINSYVK